MGSNIVRFDAIRTIAIGATSGTYAKFGAAFGHPMRVLHFINDSNGTFMISFDGITDNALLLPDSFSLYDLTSDQDTNESFRYEQGTQLWIKSVVAATVVAGTTNSIYCVAVYGKGE